MEEEFYLKVYLFKPNRVPPIKIARNSKLKITIETMDYTIPGGATASAFAKGAFSVKIYTQECTVDGNRVSFTPEPGFFVNGRNILQYEIGDSVIPLAIDVNCEISLPDGVDATKPDTVKPYVQRAESAAEKSEAAAARAQEVKDSIPEDYTVLAEDVNQLKDDIAAVSAVCGTLENTEGGTVIQLTDCADRPLKGLRIFGRTVQDGTPTPDAPVDLVSVGDGGSIVTTVAGKNLADVSGTLTSNGITHTMDATGQITSVGTLQDGYNYTNISKWIYTNLILGKTYTLSVNPVLPYNLSIKLRYIDNTQDDIILNAGYRSKKFTISKEVVRYYLFFGNIPVGSEVNLTYTLQLELGGDATDYEPYITTKTLSISTTNGLPGIPVTSGGNYTDVSGQQWVCDEVDFARGVYVKRIRKFVPKNLTKGYNGSVVYLAEYTTGFPAKPEESNSVIADIMCDSLPVVTGNYQYNNGVSSVALGAAGVGYISFEGALTLEQVNTILNEMNITVMYILATPIETALPAEELAQYAALHTNKPNATIYNDAGAQMEVSYQADTKMYIDKKINALSAAIVNNT